MKTHRPTSVQKRILSFMACAEQPVVFETGHKTTRFVNEFIVQCQSFVPHFLRLHGYIHKPNVAMSRWELTTKGIVAVGQMKRQAQ